MRLKPKSEELTYIVPFLAILVSTILSVSTGFFSISIENGLLIFGIETLLGLALIRHQMLSNIKRLLERERILIDRDKLPPIKNRLDKAKKSVYILAQSFNTLLGADHRLIQDCYNSGCEVRILLLDPRIISNTMLSDLPEEALRSSISTATSILKQYKEKSSKNGSVEASFLPFEPGFGLLILDPSEPSGEVKVELMLKGTSVSQWPNLLVTKKETERFDQLLKHFNSLWDISTPVLGVGKYT